MATTFAVILVTVLVQGATLAPLVRVLRVGSFVLMERATLSEPVARASMAAAQLAVIEAGALGADGAVKHPRLLEQVWVSGSGFGAV